MSILASNNVFPHDPEDNWKQKLDRGGYQGTAQELYDSIQELQAPDDILVKGTITKVANKLFIGANAFTCRINQQVLINLNDYETTIRSAADGYNRIDILVFTKFGTILKIEGAEGLDNAQEPDTPEDTIKISFISVFGSAIGSPEQPISNGFISKASKSFLNIINSGDLDFLLVDDRSYLKFEEGSHSLKSLKVLNTADIYHGREFLVKNGTTATITLFHNLGTGNFKFNIPGAQNLIVKPEETVHFVMRAINSSENGGLLDFVGFIPIAIDISGKEDTANKSNFVTDADSTNKYPVWNAITLWVKEKLVTAISSKVSPVGTDVLLIGDNSDSGKTKKMLFSNFITWLSSFFQTIDNQIEISENSNVSNLWHGKTVLFTANCTITVTTALNPQLDFSFRTMTGVTVTWSIIPPFVFETTPSTTVEKSVGHFMRRGNTNTIILDF